MARNVFDDSMGDSFVRVDDLSDGYYRETVGLSLPPKKGENLLEGIPAPPSKPVLTAEDKITLCGPGITRTVLDYDTIGSGRDCEIRVPGAMPRHCVFHDWNGKWFVQCIGGSRVAVNGKEEGAKWAKCFA